MQQQYQCPNCGAPVAFGVRFCGNCGALLAVGAKEEGRGTSPWLIVLVVFIAIVFLIGGILLALGSGSRVTTSPPSLPTSVPIINSFTANPTSINEGDSCTLAWDVTGATSVVIDNGIGAVPASGDIETKPSTTTTYTLIASTTGRVSESVIVTVTSLPTGMGAFRGKVLWGDKPLINGKVVADTKHPLFVYIPGVTKATNKIFNTETDKEGNYQLIIEPGTYYLGCSLPGSQYYTYQVWDVIIVTSHDVESGEVIEVNLKALDWSIELVSPGDTDYDTGSTITQNPPTLVWKKYDWAKYGDGEVGYYQVELGIYEDGYNTVMKVKTESTSYAVPNPLKTGKYKWEIKAYTKTEKQISGDIDELYFLVP